MGEPRAERSSPRVGLDSLDTLWFQVGGTVCNLACTHCFVSCSPTNHTHELMPLAEIEPYLEEAAALGVKEYYFTGGEPFLNPEMEAILERTLDYGPATVLTNGLLLAPERCSRLAALATSSPYSLDFRISMDGYDAATNDPIRGEGTFGRILGGVTNLVAAGLNPVITVTEVHDENGSVRGKERFFTLLRELGIDIREVLATGESGTASTTETTTATIPTWEITAQSSNRPVVSRVSDHGAKSPTTKKATRPMIP